MSGIEALPMPKQGTATAADLYEFARAWLRTARSNPDNADMHELCVAWANLFREAARIRRSPQGTLLFERAARETDKQATIDELRAENGRLRAMLAVAGHKIALVDMKTSPKGEFRIIVCAPTHEEEIAVLQGLVKVPQGVVPAPLGSPRLDQIEALTKLCDAWKASAFAERDRCFEAGSAAYENALEPNVGTVYRAILDLPDPEPKFSAPPSPTDKE